jgi:glycosyltransferase involved in cell wall biosynthesis
MRICFYNPVSLTYFGGRENWIIKVAGALSATMKVAVLAHSYADTRRLSYSELKALLGRVEYREIPSVKLPRGFPVPHPRHLGDLVDFFNTCDVVYVTMLNSPNESLLASLLGRIRAELIAGFHDTPTYCNFLSRLYRPVLLRSLKIFSCFHVVNKHQYAWLRALGIETNRIFYVPNGVDVDKFQCRDATRNLDRFNVLFVGRLTKDKGVKDLVKVIRYVNDVLKLNRCLFTIVGSGPLEDEIRKLTERYDNVRYMGFVALSLISRVYFEADLFLLPSRSEGMPLRLLEAQASGLPVVAYNIPGVSDVVVDGVTGKLVPVGDLGGLADAVRGYYVRWLSSPNEYDELKRKIQSHIAAKYSWNIMIERLRKLFAKPCRQR